MRTEIHISIDEDAHTVAAHSTEGWVPVGRASYGTGDDLLTWVNRWCQEFQLELVNHLSRKAAEGR